MGGAQPFSPLFSWYFPVLDQPPRQREPLIHKIRITTRHMSYADLTLKHTVLFFRKINAVENIHIIFVK